MEKMTMNAWLAVLVGASMLGCAGRSHDELVDASAGAYDAGRIDADAPDASATDASAPDASATDASAPDASATDAFVCGDLGTGAPTLSCSLACGGCASGFDCLDPCEFDPSLPQCAEPNDVGLCLRRCDVHVGDCPLGETCLPDPRALPCDDYCPGYCGGSPIFASE